MGGEEDDERFKHISRDPKFKRIPYEKRKIKIDKRFQSMFKDDKFKVTYTVDKRGFPVKQSNTDDFKKFYNLDNNKTKKDKSIKDSDEDDDDEKDEESGKEEDSNNEDNDEDEDEDDKEEEDVDDEEDEKDKVVASDSESDEDDAASESDGEVDYARGIGINKDVESSSDEESSEDEGIEDKFEHGWGELDADAASTEEVTHRLACLHMDWDRIKAKDLMVLFNSFVPQGGLIKSVNIYPSEFGKKRLAEEEVKGPQELVEHSEGEDGEGDQSTEGNAYHREKLRKYQLNRLKYYYAIIEFDSPDTANKVYTECDGMEYESSATKLDLRFVPDDTEFDEEAKESCTELPDLSKYKPRYFLNSALQQVKVNCTWDETDPDRIEAVSKMMSGDVDEHYLRDYVATSSEDEDEDDKVTNDNSDDDNEIGQESKEDVINKYRSLLKSITDDEDKKKKDVELEISWGVGLEEKTKERIKDKNKQELTPFQQLLEKKKEKRKMKKVEKEQNKKDEDNDDEDDNDDVPSDIDLSDPYFKEEIDAMKKTNNKVKNKNKTATVVDSSDFSEDDMDEANQQANLELLLMDDNADTSNKKSKHFNMKKIEDAEENEGKKKRKKKSMKNYKKKKIEEKLVKKEEEDGVDFEVDVTDNRFSAVYTSHHYNIDPADPHFKKTKAMKAIIHEKLKRRTDTDPESIDQIQNSGPLKKKKK